MSKSAEIPQKADDIVSKKRKDIFLYLFSAKMGLNSYAVSGGYRLFSIKNSILQIHGY
jgi:hypothetical protein